MIDANIRAVRNAKIVRIVGRGCRIRDRAIYRANVGEVDLPVCDEFFSKEDRWS